MVLFGPKTDVFLKKKGLHRNLNGFSGQNQVISKKNKALHLRFRWAFYFSLLMDFDGPPLELMGLLKSMGPGVIVFHCPPLSVALITFLQTIFLYTGFSITDMSWLNRSPCSSETSLMFFQKMNLKGHLATKSFVSV